MRLALTALLVLTSPAFGEGPFNAGAPQGAEQTAFIDRGADTYPLPIGAFSPEQTPVKTLTGRVVWSGYRLDDPAASTQAVMAGYRARLEEGGFQPVFECANRTCGGFDFRFGASILPPPGMLLDGEDFRQLSAYDGGSEHVSILVSRVLESIYVQTVSVSSGSEPIVVEPAPQVETDPGTVILPMDERALFDELMENGHVSVSALDFDSGGATLSAGSDQAIALLARLLARNGNLSVAIVGHSDNSGGLDANIDLSHRRAAAVRDALIASGVAAARLEARGIGYLAPITSNATEEGRAINRRVELVLR